PANRGVLDQIQRGAEAGGLSLLGSATRAERAQAVQALFRVGIEGDLADLTVGDHRDAAFDLLLDDVLGRLANSALIVVQVDGLAVVPGKCQLQKVLRTRQAASMGGENAPLAALHAFTPVPLRSSPSCIFQAMPFTLGCAATIWALLHSTRIQD